MAFENKEHEEFHNKLKEMVYSLYGEANVSELNERTLYMWRGSTVVHVGSSTYGEEDKPAFEVWCKVTIGTPLTEALARYLIVENSTLNFGAFSFYPFDEDPDRGNVIFEIKVPAFALSRDYLDLLVRMVSWTGDEYDDQIAQRFGGRTMEEYVDGDSTPSDKSEDEVWE